jgi:ABC-type lipoprotein export system ATPase subunit
MTIIECSQIHYSYFTGAGEILVLRGLDIKVKQGEHVAIVGPSGAGKTTLLRLCAALDWPMKGEVLIGGVSTRELYGKELARFRRERVGLVFQQYSLLPSLSALENVMLPLLPYCSRPILRKRAISLLHEVGLEERLDRYSDQLSGGEQQRVAIARALIASPPLLLADEPTGSLDSVTGKHVMTLLETLCRERGCTLVVVTHDASFAAMADRIVRMMDGCVENASTTSLLPG